MPLSTRNNNQQLNGNTNKSVSISNYNSNPNGKNGIEVSFPKNNTSLETVNIMSLLGNNNPSPLSLGNLNAPIPGYENSKCSVKSLNIIKAYAANTHQGIIRYNFVNFI